MQRQSLRLFYMGQCLCTDPTPAHHSHMTTLSHSHALMALPQTNSSPVESNVLYSTCNMQTPRQPQDSSPPSLRKCVKFVQKPPTEETRRSDCQRQGARRNPDFQCEQSSDLRIRVHIHVEILKKFFQVA